MWAKNSSQKLLIFALELVGVNLVSRSAMISTGTPFPSAPNTTWLMKSSATTLPSDLFHVGRHLTFLLNRSTTISMESYDWRPDLGKPVMKSIE